MSKTNDSIELIPNGGFPPIYICTDKIKRLKDKTHDEEEAKKRQYKTHKTSVSIKKIMEQRRNVNPFIKV